MPKVVIIYDSVSGNTEAMARAIAEGASAIRGIEVELHKVGTRFPMSLLNEASAIIIGSPTEYGSVTHEMKPFLESMTELKMAKKLRLRNVIGGVFGSYTFDGGWVADALAVRMRKLGFKLILPIVSAVDHEGTMGGSIDKESLDKCNELGRAVATKILQP